MPGREPDKVLPSGVPRILLSESDFHDPDRRDGGGLNVQRDFIEHRADLVGPDEKGEEVQDKSLRPGRRSGD